jgi:hypothetical protein
MHPWLLSCPWQQLLAQPFASCPLLPWPVGPPLTPLLLLLLQALHPVQVAEPSPQPQQQLGQEQLGLLNLAAPRPPAAVQPLQLRQQVQVLLMPLQGRQQRQEQPRHLLLLLLMQELVGV